jgi:hypothetical protein
MHWQVRLRLSWLQQLIVKSRLDSPADNEVTSKDQPPSTLNKARHPSSIQGNHRSSSTINQVKGVFVNEKSRIVRFTKHGVIYRNECAEYMAYKIQEHSQSGHMCEGE